MRFARQNSQLRNGGTACAALLLALFISGRAWADVIEIEPNGSVVTYSDTTSSLRQNLPSSERFGAYRAARRHQRDEPQVQAALQAAAQRHFIDERLLGTVAWQESHWNVGALSKKGARGVMQLMPATAAALQIDPADLDSNVDGGAAYLANLLQRFDGDLVSALAAYNSGPAAVERYHGVPPYPETQRYVSAILDRLAEISCRPP